MRKQPSQRRIDPFMQDVPYIIIKDAKGKVIAEVFKLPTSQLRDGLVEQKKIERSNKVWKNKKQLQY
ncbi:MAG: hypothetical protein NAG76_22310 [Candidatus Pristimantibacillus lignocellulolyticus]|uniref:Uncharacterized protein n=1 Tax=Candidatus Pristimantibacillus lignocellulolyticus TaxID=2994561 RepID=A0A9J6ZEN6_9BACL|nr:MAG: hypothetical protein NAG76_22310 [Candidatus Pristimantibacillus lignocellulolyticus]